MAAASSIPGVMFTLPDARLRFLLTRLRPAREPRCMPKAFIASFSACPCRLCAAAPAQAAVAADLTAAAAAGGALSVAGLRFCASAEARWALL